MEEEAAMPMMQRLLADEPSPPSHYIDAAHLPWEATKFPGIEMKLLFSDPNTGMSTMLFRLAPGAVVPLHEHTGIEQTYMLEGSLVDDEGECGPGSFVWRPAGNTHLARSPQGAVFLSVFMKPNHFAEGHEFFTGQAPIREGA
jgi:anti-sigma factor ChrR (cupin superfamily)